MITIKNINIDLDNTITCGQIFRYYVEDDNSYTIILSDRVVNIKKVNNDLEVKSNNYDNLESIIRKYLDLDRDYDSINNMLLSKDPNLYNIINSCNGFKIMNTPKFETCISYILSSNNRVPQIRNSLNLISLKFGKKIIFNNNTYYLFPSINDLKDISINDLHDCKVGFRDKYLYDFINGIKDNKIDLDYISSLNTDDALKYLMNIKGIGLKVSSCILLFAYQRFDVFPIDTWVKKYFKSNYNLDNIKDIKEYCYSNYGSYCGLVIQYIFNYSRNIS